MLRRLKQIIVGRPLLTEEIHEQRLSKKAALTVFSSDALSSTAYATDEILLALMVGGVAALSLSLPVAILIVTLLVIVVTSYGQTIHAYPTGGGAYTVAKQNLGVGAGLLAGAALLVDYVLTVAVSVAAGIAAITSAVPALYPERVWLCLLAISIVLGANLRGVRESAAAFAGPVYFFIASAYLLILGGLWQYYRHPPQAAPIQAAAPVGLAATVLMLRAFSSGCAALTGVEAISNGVRAFKPPVSRNATTTLYIMAMILGTMFLGVTVIAHHYGILPRDGETVLSQLGQKIFGRTLIYFVIQIASMAILILAANTSFADFPRLASILARDRFLPRQFANLGDRLVFSNGIIILALAAGFLVVIFGGSVHRLIPLYAIGVFLSFTLSQAGMVVHWYRERSRGWQRRLLINAIGAAATAVVILDLAIFKFLHGAWVVLVILPVQVWVFRKIREHYFLVAREISVADYEHERPRQIKHTVVVPVPGINKAVLTAIEYARSISRDVIAVLVNVDGKEREEILRQWEDWAGDIPLVVLEAPYRSILRPLLRFIDEVGKIRDDDVVTVVLPESVPARWWHHLLHNQTSLLIKGALLFKPKIVVTSIPHHLER